MDQRFAVFIFEVRHRSKDAETGRIDENIHGTDRILNLFKHFLQIVPVSNVGRQDAGGLPDDGCCFLQFSAASSDQGDARAEFP